MACQTSDIKLKIYGDIVPSKVDGPGQRVVVHTAGCTVGCPGCFSPHTHNADGPNTKSISPADFAEQTVAAMKACGATGVTVSGGEPTDQLRALGLYLSELRLRGVDSIVLFSGRRIEWLRQQKRWQMMEHCKLVDVLIDGPFNQKQMEEEWLRGSRNQRIIPLTDRHEVSQFQNREVEVFIHPETRKVTFLGFPDKDMIEAFSV